jgi:solute carrier family 25 S-adenosylmethionine transporter 26
MYPQTRVALWLDRPIKGYEAAACGSFAGAIAAALTTPLDVMKTRLMLGTVSLPTL